MPSRLLALLTLVALVAIPAAATPPGHVAHSGRVLGPNLDLKDGAGIADPSDPTNPCTTLLHGRDLQARPTDWRADLRISTNAATPTVGVSPLAPPLQPAGGWLPGSGGLPLGIPCPLAGSPPTGLWLVWSGMNWHGGDATHAALDLCTQHVFLAIVGTGCFPIPGSVRLVAAACTTWAAATFSRDHADAKGKDLAAWDRLGAKSDAIDCPTRHAHDHSADLTVSPFEAALGERTIKNAHVVHPGSGTTYMALCWRAEFLLVFDPLNPMRAVAQAHDWRLVIDVADPLGAAGTALAVANHLGPGGTATALQGVHSASPTPAGENGYGPCPDSAPSIGKPAPLV